MSAVTTPTTTTSNNTIYPSPVATSPTPSPSPSSAPTPIATTAVPPVSTIPQNLLLTDTGAPTIITDTGATVDPLTMSVTDLGQDTSGLLPNDWDVEPFAPSLYTRVDTNYNRIIPWVIMGLGITGLIWWLHKHR